MIRQSERIQIYSQSSQTSLTDCFTSINYFYMNVLRKFNHFFSKTELKMQLQQRQFDYSLKNIPIASKATHMKSFISKLESFIRRIRWKAFFSEHNNDENNEQKTETFGFKSELAPPATPMLACPRKRPVQNGPLN